MHSWTATLLWVVPLGDRDRRRAAAARPRASRCTLAFAALGFLIGDLAIAAERFHPAGGVQFQQTHTLGLRHRPRLPRRARRPLAGALRPRRVRGAVVPRVRRSGRARSSRGVRRALAAARVGADAALLGARPVLFYVGFEAMLIPLAFLMGIWGGERRVQATTRFLVYTLVGSLLMLVSIITLGLSAGSFDLDQIGTSGSTWLFLAFMIAFAIKAPLYPFHGWVPSAYRESPPEVAAMLSGVVSKAGAYGMLRFALPLFPGPAADWQPVLAHALARRPALVLARRVPPARLARHHRLLVDRADEPDLARDLRLQRPGRHGRGVPDGQPRPALGAALPARRAGSSCASAAASSTRVGALARGRPALATICITTGIATLAVPGSSLFASEFLVLLGAFREFWLVGTLASITIVLAAMYMLRWISAVLHDPPGEAATPAPADAGGIRDLRWEAVWLVAAGRGRARALGLPVLRHAPRGRVGARTDGAGGAGGRRSDPDPRHPVVGDRAGARPARARLSAPAHELASSRARGRASLSGSISMLGVRRRRADLAAGSGAITTTGS